MFGFLKEKLTKVYDTVTKKLSALFARGTVDEAWLQELKRVLLGADAGRTVTTKIIEQMRTAMQREELSGEQAHAELQNILRDLLPPVATNPSPTVLLMVGINGSGKTTFVGKLANKLVSEGKKVLLVAGDTFRAAATDQLAVWAERTGAYVHTGRDGQDPASVVFDACQRFKDEGYDHLIIDTAGRLQTKVNLMNELAKIGRIVHKQLPNHTQHTWLSLDSMLGQNSIAQAQQFHEATTLSGLVLTKCDGTGKGGFLFAVSHELQIPVQYITFGEKLDAIAPFNGEKFIEELLAL